MIAEVIINSTAKKLNRTFDYHVPEQMEDYIIIGSKVLVPFANFKSPEEAYVIGLKEKSEYKVKDIIKIEDNLSDKQIELAKWMAKKYYCNLSDCIKLMLTPGTRNKNIANRITDKKINVVYPKKAIEELEYDLEVNIKTDKQKKVVKFVLDNPGCMVSEIEMFTDCSRGIVNTLVKNGYLEISEKKINRNPLINKNIERSSKLELTEEQQKAYNNVEKALDIYKQFLLFGVTGSGKTEIYLQLIEKVLLNEKSAIMLVPEISLTPQIINRFVARFGKEKIAVLHSKLSIGERHDEWERIREGKARIIIGARSAIFAPVQNLGIIIIDEEHDSSYKSETTPKYQAKEVARKIAKECKCSLVLGSATPDISTYYKSEIGEIERLELTKRANKSKLPKVEIIDLKQELANGNHSMLSNDLYSSIGENLKNKEQTILFLNRRGFSTFIMCRECGYTVKCKNCNISLTYHKFENKLKCHYCGYEEPLVKICPECGSDKIRYFGTGTQKLEEEIKAQFPNSKTIRMDIDTVSKKNSHEKIIEEFKKENADILIGTQMVVKGHHFPNVTLVGAVAADSSLNIDDYRANERTFQTLTQVAGRAGRGEKAGKVIIQTYNPQEFSIKCAQKQDYLEFYKTEKALREQLKYPPFCDIIVIGFSGQNKERIIKLSNNVHKHLSENLDQDKFKVLRPMPAPIDKIQNKYRWRIIIKGTVTDETNEILNKCLNKIYKSKYADVRVSADINPNNMV